MHSGSSLKILGMLGFRFFPPEYQLVFAFLLSPFQPLKQSQANQWRLTSRASGSHFKQALQPKLQAVCQIHAMPKQASFSQCNAATNVRNQHNSSTYQFGDMPKKGKKVSNAHIPIGNKRRPYTASGLLEILLLLMQLRSRSKGALQRARS